MKKTHAPLADGREIIYFDESDDAERVLVDPRSLARTTTRSETRYDALLDEWVSIASHRQGRTHLPPTDECPLCPSTEARHTEIPSPAYDVVVFENRFPSFATSVAGVPPLRSTDEQDLFVRQPGHGRCEVICFTSDHDSSFSHLSPARVRTVLEAWVDRTQALAELPHVEQVFCFENRGEEIGVTLGHPHGQIYGYPFVTSRTRQQLDSARRHRERTWRNLFADVLAAEQSDGSRVVTRGTHWTAFVPFAARWPMEVHVYPHRQMPDLPSLTDEERAEFAEIYLDVLHRFDALYDSPMPYISAWHQAPVRIDRDLAYLHLELFSVRRGAGKLKYLAGSESGMGAFVNDVRPEQAAAALRDALRRS
ncbi:MAG: galactose-1-phosphate uridylyltransferase [Actinomycetes bacterium]